MIQHPARRADDDLCACFQGFGLCAIAYAAIDRDCAQPCAGKEHFGFVSHLPGQFTGGGQNEGLTLFHPGVEPFQHWQQKGAGLAAACAGLDHHILFCQQMGNGPCLDRHQLCPPGPAYSFGQTGGKGFEGYVG